MKAREEYLNLPVDIQITREATIATVLFSDPVSGLTMRTTGVAKKHTDDKFDAEIGADLALSRAFESLAHKLNRRANGRVKCAEDNRIASEEAAKKKAEKAAAEAQGQAGQVKSTLVQTLTSGMRGH